MLDLGGDHAVLRLWAISEAPPEFQQALGTQATDLDCWVAHVPPELVNEPLIALLSIGSSPSRPPKTILLKDGSTLFSGPLSTCPLNAEAQKKTVYQERLSDGLPLRNGRVESLDTSPRGQAAAPCVAALSLMK